MERIRASGAMREVCAEIDRSLQLSETTASMFKEFERVQSETKALTDRMPERTVEVPP